MPTLNPYLNFPGTAEEAFQFYRSVFGGEFMMLQRFKDTPAGGAVSVEDGEKVMHIALAIGKNVLMATDAVEGLGKPFQTGTNFSLSLQADSKEEADRLFNALSTGGEVTMALADAFWGAYFGMFTDKFGIQWMVNYDHGQKA